MARPTKKVPHDAEKRIEILCEFISEYFEVSIEDLKKRKRNEGHVRARFFFVAMGIGFYKNLQACADFLDEKYHTSIMYARDSYNETMSSRFPSARKRVWSRMEMRYNEYLKSLGYEKHDTVQVATDAAVAH